MVDEAYSDFCDLSALPLLSEHPNLVVMRTFSKWFRERERERRGVKSK